jgi:hypothetical protein
MASTLDQPKTVLHRCGGTLTPCLDGVHGLRLIEAADNILRDAGFYEVRVRHHQKRGTGATAQTMFPSNYRRTE